MDPYERLRAGLQWYGHPHVLSIPIPKTLVIWASPSHTALAIWVRVRVTGDAHITRGLGMGVPISVWQRFRGEWFMIYTVIATAAFPPSTVLYFLVYTLRLEVFKIYGSSKRSQFNTKDLLANSSCRAIIWRFFIGIDRGGACFVHFQSLSVRSLRLCRTFFEPLFNGAMCQNCLISHFAPWKFWRIFFPCIPEN